MSQYDQLVEEFPPEVLRVLPKAGGLTYVPVAEVITRLNTVLGVGGWGFTITGLYREPDDRDWIIATVEISAIVDGERAIRGGVGGYNTANVGMDLADANKSAVSEALKKAAQSLGVGLHLSRKEEAKAMDAIADQASDLDVNDFVEKMKLFPDGIKNTVKEFARDSNINWRNMSNSQLDSLKKFIDELTSFEEDPISAE